MRRMFLGHSQSPSQTPLQESGEDPSGIVISVQLLSRAVELKRSDQDFCGEPAVPQPSMCC